MRRLALLAWLLAGAGAAGAVTPAGLRLYATTAWTDNLFQSYSERSDWLRRLAFDVDLGSAALGAWYSGRVDLYGDNEDLFSHTHTVGVGVRRTGLRRRLLSASVSAALRDGRAVYDYRDYLETRADLEARLYPRPTLLVRAGTSVAVRDYRHAGDFSYAEPSAWVQVSRFLPTRTTLVAGADAGAKVYLSAGADTTAVWARTTGENALTLASLWFQVAQSLAPRTGLQLRFSRQTLWQDRPRFRPGEDYDPVGELFDDAYSHSGHQWRLSLKHRGRHFDTLLCAHTGVRRYDNRPAFDLEGQDLDTTRRDRRAGVRLRLSRDLAALAARRDAAVHVEATALSVDSNDPYYDTSARWLSLSLELGL